MTRIITKIVSIRYEELKIYSRAIVIFRVTLNYFELLVILLQVLLEVLEIDGSRENIEIIRT